MTLTLKTEPEKVQNVAKEVRREWNLLDKWIRKDSNLSVTIKGNGEILVKVAPLCVKIMKAKLREWLVDDQQTA